MRERTSALRSTSLCRNSPNCGGGKRSSSQLPGRQCPCEKVFSITEHHCYKTPPHTYSHGYEQKGENNQVGKHVEKLEPSASLGWGWYKVAHSLWEMGYYCQLDLESLGEVPLGTPMRDYLDYVRLRTCPWGIILIILSWTEQP